MKLKEESEKAGLKLKIQKAKIMASDPIPSWQIDRETMEAVTDFIFLGSKITADDDSLQFSSAQFICSVMSDSLRAHGLHHARPVYHQLPKLTQTLVHWASDATQPSHPLSSPSPAFSLSQHQGLFQWVSSSHQVAKVLEFQLQHQSFQWIFRTDFL